MTSREEIFRSRSVTWAAVMIPLAAYGLVAPYLSRAVGLPVPVDSTVEIVDHVVPGVVVLAVAVITLSLRRLTLVASLLATLAGFWMTATHLPLLLQAQRGEVHVGAALIHSTGGILILLLSLAGAVLAWRETPD